MLCDMIKDSETTENQEVFNNNDEFPGMAGLNYKFSTIEYLRGDSLF